MDAVLRLLLLQHRAVQHLKRFATVTCNLRSVHQTHLISSVLLPNDINENF